MGGDQVKGDVGGGMIPSRGILVVDKPRGPSSHQVTAWVGSILGRPVGHSGTLDPMVSGILVVMIGSSARLAPFLLREEKEYVALLRLHRDAGDEEIRRICTELTGRVYQRPPRRSAVARSLRIREIQEIELLERDGRDVLFRVRCDAGTYIRTLCHHIGYLLGTGGQMAELRRTRSGPFGIGDACSLALLKDTAAMARQGDPGPLRSLVLPAAAAVPGLPAVTVRDSAVDAICHGASLAVPGVVSAEAFEARAPVRILTTGSEMVAIGHALVPSSSIVRGGTGLCVTPRIVLMPRGTYARGWAGRRHSRPDP